MACIINLYPLPREHHKAGTAVFGDGWRSAAAGRPRLLDQAQAISSWLVVISEDRTRTVADPWRHHTHAFLNRGELCASRRSVIVVLQGMEELWLSNRELRLDVSDVPSAARARTLAVAFAETLRLPPEPIPPSEPALHGTPLPLGAPQHLSAPPTNARVRTPRRRHPRLSMMTGTRQRGLTANSERRLRDPHFGGCYRIGTRANTRRRSANWRGARCGHGATVRRTRWVRDSAPSVGARPSPTARSHARSNCRSHRLAPKPAFRR